MSIIEKGADEHRVLDTKCEHDAHISCQVQILIVSSALLPASKTSPAAHTLLSQFQDHFIVDTMHVV